ncbi:hypothetical protein PLESTF_000577200 [Pleodorina starrii]|nr:hypothetical protein PLESTF_000577200 [Pleodorina starrii]
MLMVESPRGLYAVMFSVNFNETVKVLFFKAATAGTWHYDAVAQREALYRVNHQVNAYCYTATAHYAPTPCKHVVTGGKRYLVFPQLGECCTCCTADKAGCGITPPDWLKDAVFQGTTEIQGIPAYDWRIASWFLPKHWYASADAAQVPLELDQMPNDRQTFWPGTFQEGPPPPDVFQLPEGCNDL